MYSKEHTHETPVIIKAPAVLQPIETESKKIKENLHFIPRNDHESHPSSSKKLDQGQKNKRRADPDKPTVKVATIKIFNY